MRSPEMIAARGVEVIEGSALAQGLRLLADETAVGQIYAIGDPELQRG